MAVSGVSSSSTSSSLYGTKNVVSGLASGIDTESIIENMVSGTRNKINKQLKAQTKLQWKQEAYRGITDKLVALSTKYTSYTSNSNLLSPSFFKPSIITPTGKYADYISASGSTNSDVKILGVSKLATTATYAVDGLPGLKNSIDASKIAGSKSIDLGGKVDVSTIAGQNLTFKYGNQTASIYLSSDREYSSVADIAEEINTQLANASVSLTNGGSVNLGDKVKASVDGDKLKLSFLNEKETNTLEITDGSSETLLSALHLSAGSKMTSAKSTLTSSSNITASDYTTKVDTKEVLAGATFNFTYNGNSAKITIPKSGTDEYEKIFGDGIDGKDRNKALTDYLQNELNKQFGFNRVTVSNANGDNASSLKLQFDVADGDKGKVLTVTSSASHIMGKSGILGMDATASNRINTDKSLKDLVGGDVLGTMAAVQDGGKDKVDANGKKLYSFKINGVEIGQYSEDTKLSQIINDINSNKDAGVKLTYSKTSDQFVFTSTHGGAGGKVEISSDSTNDLAAMLFGKRTTTTTNTGGVDTTTTTFEPVSVTGTDAEMTVSINGTKRTLTSGTNTFDIDGFKVSSNGVFGFDEDGNLINENEAVSFNSKVDTEKIVEAVKSFVEDYNAMLDALNEQISTKPPKKSYEPLTDDEKADLSDKQIEQFESMAKQGLLFGDTDLNSLSNSLRFLFSSKTMSDIGIETSSSYSDKGKISFNETKFRAALDSDPESVASAFTDAMSQKAVTQSDGTVKYVDNTSTGGVMTRLKNVLDKYAKTTGTKGILINKAGSTLSPLSLLNNSLQTQIDKIDDTLETLYDKLDDQIDRYTQQWSRFETLISQMNSQSSYLSSMMGGASY